MLSGLSYVNAQERRSTSLAQTGTVVSQNAEKAHGGTLQTVGSIQIETVLKDKGIMFMAIDSEGQVIKPRRHREHDLENRTKPKQYTSN